MGEVYKARDTRLDRTVAIKVLPSEVAAHPDSRARFEREARAVAALDHPHICGIYDVGHVDGTHYRVMPHLEGQTLAARLEKGPLPLEQALNIATEIVVFPRKSSRLNHFPDRVTWLRWLRKPGFGSWQGQFQGQRRCSVHRREAGLVTPG
jgi:serine/threonine protein kinase